jgi:hypothetical protein
MGRLGERFREVATVNALLTVGSFLYVETIGGRQVPHGCGHGDKKGPQSANH